MRKQRDGAWVHIVAILGSVMLFGGIDAHAQSDAESAKVMRAQLDRILARQDALEQENSRLKEQVGTLETRRTASPPPAVEASEKPTGFNKGGGGFFSKGDDFNFRLLGYVQAVGSVFDSRFERADDNGDFSIRRARVDFLADYYDDYQILIEFDGGPANAQAGQSDFGLVEARSEERRVG